MFEGIHEISIQLLGELSVNYQFLYALSDIFFLLVIFISFIYLFSLPVRMIGRW